MRTNNLQRAMASKPNMGPLPSPARPQGNTSVPSILTTMGGFFDQGSNESMVQIPNERDSFDFAELVDSFKDSLAVSGDVVAYSPNLMQINQTARDIIFMPAKIKMEIDASPINYKTSVNPVSFSLDDNGLVNGGAGITQVEFLTDPGLPPVWGYAFRVQGRDTQRGTAQVNIFFTDSELNIKTQLRNINDDGWVVVLNHAIDRVRNVVPDYAVPVAPSATMSAKSLSSDTQDQYVFSPSETQDIIITGLNANVDVYPIVPRREVSAVINAMYYSDNIDKMAVGLLHGFDF